LYRFDAPIHAADAAMDTGFLGATETGTQVTLTFGSSTPSLNALAAGMYLVHNPGVFTLREPAFTGEIVLRHVLTPPPAPRIQHRSLHLDRSHPPRARSVTAAR